MTPFHISILATVKGMSRAIVDDMVKSSMNDPSDIVDAELTAKDIADALDIPIVTAGLIRKAAHAARAADAADNGEMTAALTMLGGLESSDAATRRAAVLGLQGKRILKVVPSVRGGVDLAETASLLLSNQRALAEREGLWNSRGLVDVATFMPPEPETLRSPFGAELVEQGNPLVATDSMTGIAWGMLRLSAAPAGKATLGLAMWAVSKNIHAGASEATVFNDFLTGGPISKRAADLANQLKVTRETLENMPGIKRSVPPPPQQAGRAGASGSLLGRVHDTLTSLFSGGELRRCVLYCGATSDLASGLPEYASPAEMADKVIDAVTRAGVLREFLLYVRSERPRRTADIDALLPHIK